MKIDKFSDTPNDPEDPAVEEFIEECRALAEAKDTLFAADTLHGIADTVQKTGRVTDNQRQAVRNISTGAERRERSSRRYEGWRRNGWSGQ